LGCTEISLIESDNCVTEECAKYFGSTHKTVLSLCKGTIEETQDMRAFMVISEKCRSTQKKDLKKDT
jgi:hypothetical protein